MGLDQSGGRCVMFGQLDVSGGWLGSTREKGGQVEVMGLVWAGSMDSAAVASTTER